MLAPLVIAPLLLAGVLALSGVLKVRDRQALTLAIGELRLPRILATRLVTMATPWLEVALAVLLVVAPSGWVMVTVTTAALVLFAVYFGVVARAMTFRPRPACSCFGALGDHQISARTVARNAVLVGFAVIGVIVAAYGESTWSLLSTFDRTGWLWLTMAAALLILASLVLRHSATSAAEPTAAPFGTLQGYASPPGQPGPPGRLWSLTELLEDRPCLLVLVNCSCASTRAVFDVIPRWRTELAAYTDVRLVISVPRAQLASLGAPVPDGALYDHDAQVWMTLGLDSGSPQGVLISRDGVITGGPIEGVERLDALVGAVRDGS